MKAHDTIALIDALDRTAADIIPVALGATCSAPRDVVSTRRRLSYQAHELNGAINNALSSALSHHVSAEAAALRKAYVERSNSAPRYPR
jgi:hypothetical protein